MRPYAPRFRAIPRRIVKERRPLDGPPTRSRNVSRLSSLRKTYLGLPAPLCGSCVCSYLCSMLSVLFALGSFTSDVDAGSLGDIRNTDDIVLNGWRRRWRASTCVMREEQ